MSPTSHWEDQNSQARDETHGDALMHLLLKQIALIPTEIDVCVLVLHSLQCFVSTKGPTPQSMRERIPVGPMAAVLLQYRLGFCHLFSPILLNLCRIHRMWLQRKPISGIQSGQKRCLLSIPPPSPVTFQHVPEHLSWS